MAVFTQTTTFANGQTADGGQVNTEIVNLGSSVNNIVNDQISASAAIDITKISPYTAWTAYTPTLYKNDGTTVWTTGTLNYSRYTQIGKIVIWNLTITPDNGANTGALAYTTLPVTAKSDPTYNRLAGAASMLASSNTSGWPIFSILNTAGTRIVLSWQSAWSTPNNWSDVTNPVINACFVYEAA